MSINIGMSAVRMGTKMITQEQLNEVVKEHELWLKDHKQGKRAELHDYRFGSLLEKIDLDLSGVNLSEADLSGSSFYKAKLIGVNLSGANLKGTSFMDVDLTDAVLDDIDMPNGSISHSNLTRVNAKRANFINCHMWDNCYENAVLSASRFIAAALCDGNFRGANLSSCDFRWADLDYVHFENAILSNADLRWTKNSYWARFEGANMEGIEIEGSPIDDEAVEGVKNLFIPMVCPEEGSFIAWKKCRDGKIAKILVPENALRTGGCRYTCRASEVLILDIFDGESTCEEAISIRDENIIYHKGELVKDEEEFDNSLLHNGTGIHFFITRAEAERAEFVVEDDEPNEEDEDFDDNIGDENKDNGD